MPEAYTAPLIFSGHEWLVDHAVIVDGPRIDSVAPLKDLPTHANLINLEQGMLVPGLIDLQVNGGGGALLNNSPDAGCVAQICNAHLERGTTSLLPTLLSDTRSVTESAIAAVNSCDNPGVLGIHLEGPHFATSRRGAHAADRLRPLENDDVEALCKQARNLRTVLTLAPETATPQQISQLSAAGVMVCGGHSEATFEQAEAAIAAGLRGFTHLFNAMSPLTARKPGMVGAALSSDTTWAGIIADGHHVHPAAILTAWRAMAPGKLFLVSDAMTSAASALTSFPLYGAEIELHNGRLQTSDGVLAGSNITLLDAVSYCYQTVGLDLVECLRMASLYPAQFLRCDDHLGRLAANCRADMLHLTDGLDVCSTWLAGKRRT
ncbi:N-acetylglucosamine-6-phosphate deacetylase [Halieaceae bacterium IMCC14734]|uniref:N-acetylglucosamine-6-phosphate deacetylase n=1 Tax=Candidatus Litorirhabdus singularis TaxID=2518993 RepID=A0ABT3TE52_9GAMM|nr:N-acetylglucosamine-6-phosphate deacetylase [Candidatus Litorirhabdus singularis]MCX2979712.1 N-acetylglucosamine-6-phosphate deacetylase [Candidatus Litorirhabdus singularis]